MSRRPPLSRYWNEAEAQGRGYLRPSTGERVPGVTSITGLVDKDLAQWGSDMAVKWMVENWYTWNPGARSDEKAFNGARYRWREFRNERGNVGTGVHNYIEDVILGAGPFVDDLDTEQQKIVFQWEDMCFTTGMDFWGTERQVWGDGYGGTLDAYATLNGKRVLVDWKTSKSVHWEYYMQLAALKNAQFQFTQVEDPGAGIEQSRAYPAELKNAEGVIEETWWVEEPLPELDGAIIVHLAADDWAIHELDNEPLHMARFNAYKAAWWAEKALKDVLHSQGKKLDRPVTWTDPKKK